jgi:hypothetical protein
MFKELERINERPEPFQFYTASDLWTDEHTSKQMLSEKNFMKTDLKLKTSIPMLPVSHSTRNRRNLPSLQENGVRKMG